MSLTIHSSALDNHAGSAIFEKVITGELKNKTVILVTNALQYLPKANQVVVLGDGKMQEIGTYTSLMAKKKKCVLQPHEDARHRQRRRPGKDIKEGE